MKDPIVEEVRRFRMAHTNRFNGDLDAICEDLKEIAKRSCHAVVRLPPRRAPETTASRVPRSSD